MILGPKAQYHFSCLLHKIEFNVLNSTGPSLVVSCKVGRRTVCVAFVARAPIDFFSVKGVLAMEVINDIFAFSNSWRCFLPARLTSASASMMHVRRSAINVFFVLNWLCTARVQPWSFFLETFLHNLSLALVKKGVSLFRRGSSRLRLSLGHLRTLPTIRACFACMAGCCR